MAIAMRGANAEVIGCSPSPLRMEAFADACDLPFMSLPVDTEALHWAKEALDGILANRANSGK